MMQLLGVPTVSNFVKICFGMLITGVVAAIAAGLTQYFPTLAQFGFSTLTIAIVLGIFIGNIPHGRFITDIGSAGINFSKHRLLRAGIILYGFRLTLYDLQVVGLSGFIIDLLVLAVTFFLAMYVGVRKFGLDKNVVILMGAGNSICGAAAILAAEPLLKPSPEQTTSAIASIVLFGTIAIFLYPLLYVLVQAVSGISIDPYLFGKYIGSTVHEVAQVVASSNLISGEVSNVAVITKMVRVMMLGPFLMILAFYLCRDDSNEHKESHSQAKNAFYIPWFALYFLLCIGINSVVRIPKNLANILIYIDNFLLAMAMGALGITTNLALLSKSNLKTLKLAFYLFAWLVIGGGAINGAVHFFVD